MSQRETSPTGQPAMGTDPVCVAFHPTTDAALSEQDSISRTIRDALRAACSEYGMLIIVPRKPPSRAVAFGALADEERSARIPESLLQDFDRLIECGYARGRAHGIRRAVRDYLEITVETEGDA